MTNISKVFWSASACLAALLLLGSCNVTRKSLRLPDEPELTVEQEGLSMTLRFLDEPTLKKRFGTTTNPFLTDYGRVMFRRNVVFELLIQNQGSARYRFEQQNCELQYGGKTVPPLNRFQQSSDVSQRDEDPRLKAPKTALIEKWVLPNRRDLEPGSSLRGILLFQANFPISGEAQVTIPGFEGGPYFQFSYAFPRL